MKGSIRMKENSEVKSKRSPGLLTVGGVEISAIPPSIKRMARGRKIRIWTRPFKCGLGMATDELFSENPEEVAFNQRLMKKELEVINRAVGSLNMSHIKSSLIQRCNVPDPTNLTWGEILAHLEVYLHSQKAENPAEPEQNIAPTKRRGIRARLKGLAKELYGLTIERVTKAYLDKYG